MGGQHTMGIFTSHRQACPIPEAGARLKRPLFRSVVNGNVDPDLRNVHISHHPCSPWIQKVVKLLPFLCGNQKLFLFLCKSFIVLSGRLDHSFAVDPLKPVIRRNRLVELILIVPVTDMRVQENSQSQKKYDCYEDPAPGEP